jgi:hypothetical protein
VSKAEGPKRGTTVRKNKVKQIWAEGGCVLNGWLSIPSSYSAEGVAHPSPHGQMLQPALRHPDASEWPRSS